MTMIWLRLIASIAILSFGTGYAIATPSRSASELIAEKATIIASPQSPDGELEGYLVVWNGTTEGAILTGVASDVFRQVEIVQTSRDQDGVTKIQRPNLAVPAHAELVMLQRGVHLHLQPKKPIASDDVVILDLAFADGTVRSVSATIEQANDAAVVHHHDPSSPEWLRLLDGGAGASDGR